MVIIGLTPEALGKLEPSITKRLRTSHVSPSGLVVEVLGELPRRAVPIMWKEKSASRPDSQPAESIACVKESIEPLRPGSKAHHFACDEKIWRAPAASRMRAAEMNPWRKWPRSNGERA